jgi:hypothetical protein
VISQPVGFLLASLALAIMSPFAIVIALVCWSGMALWDLVEARFRQIPARTQGILYRLVWIALGGLPMLAYQLFAISSDSLLSGWGAQNLTAAPPLWDVAISLSPLLILAPFGVRAVLSSGHEKGRLLVVWCVASLVLLYAPWTLQRRFMMGIFIPVVTLAALSLDGMVKDVRRFWFRGVLLIIWVLPTNFLVFQAGLHGINTRDSSLYLSRDESAGLDWIETNTPPDALILAAPETGLFIPTHTGRRVIYGHPYETVQAESQKIRVERFFRGTLSPDTDILLRMADYIYYGPREREIGWNVLLEGLRPVYKNQSVLIYSTK